jgi:hypothetical protein
LIQEYRQLLSLLTFKFNWRHYRLEGMRGVGGGGGRGGGGGAPYAGKGSPSSGFVSVFFMLQMCHNVTVYGQAVQVEPMKPLLKVLGLRSYY